MAAEIAKLRVRGVRVRGADDFFIVGEHVFVDATVFDDPKSPPEDRFSTTCKEVLGFIVAVRENSCRVEYPDGGKSNVAKAYIRHQSESQKQLVTTTVYDDAVDKMNAEGENEDEDEDIEDNDHGDDADWEADSNDDDDNNSDEDEDRENRSPKVRIVIASPPRRDRCFNLTPVRP